VNDALRAFLDGDVTAWAGLDAITIAEFGALLEVDLTARRRNRDDRGDPPVIGEWVAAPTKRFAGGLRIWLEDGDRTADRRVVLIEGIAPRDDAGQSFTAPDLGPADLLLDAQLGPLLLDGGERVYSDRGLAIRVNPENGVLLGLLGFGPMPADDYRTRLRPAPIELRPLPEWEDAT
jgi:hypothetical protein